MAHKPIRLCSCLWAMMCGLTCVRLQSKYPIGVAPGGLLPVDVAPAADSQKLSPGCPADVLRHREQLLLARLCCVHPLSFVLYLPIAPRASGCRLCKITLLMHLEVCRSSSAQWACTNSVLLSLLPPDSSIYVFEGCSRGIGRHSG